MIRHPCITSFRSILTPHLTWLYANAILLLCGFLVQGQSRAELLQQLQQGMAGTTWEPQDWEWRPTWTPSMRRKLAAPRAAAAQVTTAVTAAAVGSTNVQASHIKGLDMVQDSSSQDNGNDDAASGSTPPPAAAAAQKHSASDLLDVLRSAACGASEQQQQQQTEQLLSQLTLSLAGLEAPQRSFKLLQDTALLSWYQTSIAGAIQAVQAAAVNSTTPADHAAAAQHGSPAATPLATGGACTCASAGSGGRGPVVLVLANGGGGLLGLIAASSGAGSVVVMEKYRWGCRAAQQLLEANREAHADFVSKVEVVQAPLSSCFYAAEADTSSTCTQDDISDVDAVVRLVSSISRGQPGAAQGAGRSQSASAATFRMMKQADVLVTDMFDYRCAATRLPQATVACCHVTQPGSGAAKCSHTVRSGGMKIR